MGLENSVEKLKNTKFEKEFTELTEKEREVKEKLKAIFRENAELSGQLLSSDDLNLSPHQIIYRMGQVGNLRKEAKDVLSELRGKTGSELPKEFQGVQVAKEYYEKIAA